MPPVKYASRIEGILHALAFWHNDFRNGPIESFALASQRGDEQIYAVWNICAECGSKGAQRGTQLSFVDNNGVLEGTATYPGGSTMHETTTISADGNTITSPSKANFLKGTFSWIEVWERVPDKKRK
jgi:hypothetical protein